jgi:hypothetical protein
MFKKLFICLQSLLELLKLLLLMILDEIFNRLPATPNSEHDHLVGHLNQLLLCSKEVAVLV